MTSRGLLILAHPVRLNIVLPYFARLALSLAGLVAVPLVVALIYGEFDFAWRLALVLGLLVGLIGPLARRQVPREIQVNEALVIVALLFVLSGLIMSWPLTATGLPYLDLLFESVSGVTTTGLSTLASVEGLPATFLFARAWMQWYGGLVIVVLALAFIIRPGGALRRLTAIEGEQQHDLVGGTRIRARRVLLVYLALTAAAVGLFWLLGAGGFDGLLYALAAVSTGGFSPHDDSIAGLGGAPLRVAVIAVGLSGAVSFALYFRAWRDGPASLIRDRELHALLAACLLTTICLALAMALLGDVAWPRALFDALLLGVSAQSTAGFAATSPAGVSGASKLVLIAAMLVGGDMGSTAGGIKILRILLVLRLLHLLFARASLPAHAVVETRVAGRAVDDGEIQTAVSVVLMFAVAVAASWFAFVAAGHDPLDALFDVVSAIGTVGLSTGIVGPDLEPGLKLLLCLDMLMGRLEIVAILLLLYPRTWFAMRREAP